MQKIKRIFAITIIIILAGLYLSSFVFALIGSSRALDWLKVSIYATIVLPVLLWTYSFIYKMVKNAKNEDRET